MKIETVHNKIRSAVAMAERITKRQSTLPILACLYFETINNNSVLIKSTNLDLGFEIIVSVKVEEEGSCAVPASVISAFLSNVPESNKIIKISTDGGTVKISAGSASAGIKTIPTEDFPVIPHSTSKNTFSIQGSDFVKGLKSVWYSSSVSSVKPELSSVYVHCDGEFVVFAATDSFRLAEKKMHIKKTADFNSILIPFVSVPEIVRVLEGTGSVDVILDQNQISFSFENTYLVSRIIDGVFPDYKQIIPKSFLTEAVALKQDLVNALKLSNIFSDKFNQIGFSIDPSKKLFELSTKNSVVGENNVSVDAAITGEKLSINFNQKYVNDCFQSIDTDSVSLHFGGMNKPLLITPGSDQSFRYLVMPMNR
jgi:DNA polymerase III subunit beta